MGRAKSAAAALAQLPPRAAQSSPQREVVVSYVRRALVTGELRPGEKLREVRLAEYLGVSRQTLREGLQMLVQDGLLIQEPYRGYSMAELTPQALTDLARTRVPLDLLAIEGILTDPTRGRMDVLMRSWETFDRLATHPDPLVRHEAHVAFHHGMWLASQNQILIRMWPVIEAASTLALAQDQAVRADPGRARELHAHLIEAICSRDPSNIEHALQTHTIRSSEELVNLTDA